METFLGSFLRRNRLRSRLGWQAELCGIWTVHWTVCIVQETNISLCGTCCHGVIVFLQSLETFCCILALLRNICIQSDIMGNSNCSQNCLLCHLFVCISSFFSKINTTNSCLLHFFLNSTIGSFLVWHNSAWIWRTYVQNILLQLELTDVKCSFLTEAIFRCPVWALQAVEWAWFISWLDGWDRQSSHPVKTLLQYYGKSWRCQVLPTPVSGTTAAP